MASIARNQPTALIIIALFLMAVYGRGEAELRFNDFFVSDSETYIRGDGSNPILSCYNVLFADGKIYIPDYLSHAILIYDKLGNILGRIGGKLGNKPGQLNMPYGLLIGRDGFLYVNDRGNNRIQVFDANLRNVRSFPVPGPIESIALSTKGNLILVAVSPIFGGKAGPCLAHEINIYGKSVGIPFYSTQKKVFPMYSWAIALDVNDQVYIANVLEKEISIFNSKRRAVKTIVLSSATIKPISDKIKPVTKTFSDLWNNRNILDGVGYTKISRMFIIDQSIFVLFRTKKHPEKRDVFILDIYNVDGNAVYRGIETPGEMYYSQGRFYFVNYDDSEENGLVKITAARPKNKSLF